MAMASQLDRGLSVLVFLPFEVFFMMLPHLSKGNLSKDTLVQGDFGPRRLLSKKALTRDKLAQIIFFYSLLDITILIDDKMTKRII